MARLWRISNFADLSGTGGRLGPARWSDKGRPVVYAAEHTAGALAEILVHLDRRVLPDTLQLLEIELDESASMEAVGLDALGPDWRMDEAKTRAIGDAWLAGNRSVALRVPCALVPEAWNILLNPSHPEAGKIRIVSIRRFPLDQRFGDLKI